MKKIIYGLLALSVMVTMNSCEKKTICGCTDPTALNYNSDADEEDGTCTYYTIGQEYGGGIVFYVDGTKKHGLICASTDQSSGTMWAAANDTATHATGTEVGTGLENTTIIYNAINGTYFAAGLCYNLELGGYSDWYLPSLNELLLMFNYLHKKGLGGFSTCNYWSSSESATYSGEAWLVYFGSTQDYIESLKTNTSKVRAVRSF